MLYLKKKKKYLKYTNYANTWSIRINEEFFPDDWKKRYKEDKKEESVDITTDDYTDVEHDELDF